MPSKSIIFTDNKIFLLSELVILEKKQLLKLPNFGNKSLIEVNDFLLNLNLTLGMSLQEYTIKAAFDENQKTDSPMSFYAATKKSNEVMAHSYSHLFGIPY